MGFLRFYLALCVVQAHTGNFIPWPVPLGRHAVELFFVVSGFYMAMVLSGRYRNTADFYRSRWLRIAVPYYWHLVVIVVLSFATGLFFSEWLALAAWADNPFGRNGVAGLLFAAVSNLTIFGQDAVLFLRDNIGSGLRFTGSFASYPEPLYAYLVMPQCWTVAIELVFYLSAPFLNRLRTGTLLGILTASALARLAAYYFAGLDHDPWVYRFVPFEIAFFIAGMLGWRAFAHWKAKPSRPASPSWLVYLGICVSIVIGGWFFRAAYNAMWFVPGEAYAGFFLCLAAVPFIVAVFMVTANHSFDRLVGELSYPIYLNHLFFVVAVRVAGQHIPLLAQWSGVLAAVLSVAAAALFWHFVLKRFEERRHQMFGLRPT